MKSSDKQAEARADYEAGAKYKDIAAKYDVSVNTVKSWRQRHGWQRGAPTSKKNASKAKKGAPTNAKGVHPQKAVQLVQQADLPDKRKMFVLYYLQSFNATKSYMQAYGADYQTAMANGSRLLGVAKVRELIDKLKAEHAAQLDITAMDILQEYAKQANSDLGDYLDFGIKDEPQFNFEGNPIQDFATGGQKIKHVSYIHLKNKDEVDTSLLKSVKWNQGGIVVELYDKQKAMDALLQRLPDQDELLEAKIRKAKAEADIAEAQARDVKVDSDGDAAVHIHFDVPKPGGGNDGH